MAEQLVAGFGSAGFLLGVGGVVVSFISASIMAIIDEHL